MKIEIESIYKETQENMEFFPTRATKKSVGYDLYFYDPDKKEIEINFHSWVVLKTGFTVRMSKGVEAQIRSKSGLAANKGLFVLNSPGTIDPDYYPNEIQVILYNLSNFSQVIKRGEKIAQMVFSQTFTASNEIVPEETRKGGFGSTGVNKK